MGPAVAMVLGLLARPALAQDECGQANRYPRRLPGNGLRANRRGSLPSGNRVPPIAARGPDRLTAAPLCVRPPGPAASATP
eukprot:gene2854-3449_t